MLKERKLSFGIIALPILFLSAIIGYGLIARPQFLSQEPFPLEIIFLSCAVFSIAQLLILGYDWNEIQNAIVKKLSRGFPAILILFSIGIIIGSWIISGTIPMLIYYGIKLINPSYIYLLSFFIPIIFSTLTGTSWGSVGTIGAVLIGIANIVGVDLGITAGAIIGGAYFGDKLSPLSDTTNLAAMAVEVDLYQHIGSMMFTTLPSALVSAVVFFVAGFIYPPSIDSIDPAYIEPTLNGISSLFNFNLLLLAPPIIVLYGSFKKYAPLPTLLSSSLVACILALVFQDYSLGNVVNTVHRGYDTSMASWALTSSPENINILFNRGGMYALNEAVVFSIMVLVFIGSLDVTNAMPTIVNKVFSFAKSRPIVIISSLIATAFTNAITSNQSATSFIIGDSFKEKYKQLNIHPKVLSRSIEDYGTMIESLIPWTATTLFMTATLGVPFSDYWHWQILSITNLVIAPILAVTGWGCFYKKQHIKNDN